MNNLPRDEKGRFTSGKHPFSDPEKAKEANRLSLESRREKKKDIRELCDALGLEYPPTPIHKPLLDAVVNQKTGWMSAYNKLLKLSVNYQDEEPIEFDENYDICPLCGRKRTIFDSMESVDKFLELYEEHIKVLGADNAPNTTSELFGVGGKKCFDGNEENHIA